MEMKGICYIFGAGEHYEPPPVFRPDRFIIAADGGYAYLLEKGMPCDLLLGDFDSFTGTTPVGVDALRLPKEKDDTDMVAAIRAGWERGFRVFHIYGGTGGRLDHTLANIQCLGDIAGRGGRGFLYDKESVITVLREGRISFPKDARGILSAFAFTDTASGVYESGLKYALRDATLSNRYPVGVSNAFVGEASSISVREGMLIVIYPKDIQEEDK